MESLQAHPRTSPSAADTSHQHANFRSAVEKALPLLQEASKVSRTIATASFPAPHQALPRLDSTPARIKASPSGDAIVDPVDSLNRPATAIGELQKGTCQGGASQIRYSPHSRARRPETIRPHRILRNFLLTIVNWPRSLRGAQTGPLEAIDFPATYLAIRGLQHTHRSLISQNRRAYRKPNLA